MAKSSPSACEFPAFHQSIPRRSTRTRSELIRLSNLFRVLTEMLEFSRTRSAFLVYLLIQSFDDFGEENEHKRQTRRSPNRFKSCESCKLPLIRS